MWNLKYVQKLKYFKLNEIFNILILISYSYHMPIYENIIISTLYSGAVLNIIYDCGSYY